MKYYITFFIIIFTTSVESYPKILTIKENSNYLLVNEKSLPIIDINILFNFGSKNDLSQKGITNLSILLKRLALNLVLVFLGNQQVYLLGLSIQKRT